MVDSIIFYHSRGPLRYIRNLLFTILTMAGNNVRGHAVLVATIAIGIIDFFAVVLRFLARKKIKAKLAVDDWLILVSLLPAYAMVGIASICQFIFFLPFFYFSFHKISDSTLSHKQNQIVILVLFFIERFPISPHSTHFHDKTRTNL